MPIATLDEVLTPAYRQGYAVAGLVMLGWEDAQAYVQAAEATGCPVILQAGPNCRKHTPLPVLGAMVRSLAEQSSQPVVCHLDHGETLDEIRQAIDCGFSSVMIDGSRLCLEDNIALSGRAAELAHQAGLGIEGEIGFVGYAEGAPSSATDPDEAGRLVHEAGLDALAVSVGNVHLQMQPGGGIDFAALDAIAAKTCCPLVLHGGSGIDHDARRKLALQTVVCKLNIGTELRRAFGAGLRNILAENPDWFDRIQILSSLRPALVQASAKLIRELAP
ncbi:MAG: class II fructose-bisphosphate aldolase [Pseudomonadota bacterium]